jgi:putative transposase
MGDSPDLVKTLDFQLEITSDNEELLREATLEARSVYNESIRLAKEGLSYRKIPDNVAEETVLVKNSTQRIVAKALSGMKRHEEEEDVGAPSHRKESAFPLRANYGEGYDLSKSEDGEISFRISAMPYKHVEGVIEGADAHLDIIRSALSGEAWNIGTAEVIFKQGTPELHVCVTQPETPVRDSKHSRTSVGVDINEDNVALTALNEEDVRDTLIIDYSDVKSERHRYFKIRKRVQTAGKESIHDTLEGCEKRYVRDRLHKVSRHIVEWTKQFDDPCLVFEDLKEMRRGLDFGTRMNLRLHHLPFRVIQFYTSYKAAFEGIPTAWIDPEYTSQRCPMCTHTERGNRKRKRFKCRSCEHQDHADRNASVNIAMKGIKEHLRWNVPALKTLPGVRKVRRQATGAVDAPTVTHATVRGDHTEGATGVSP